MNANFRKMLLTATILGSLLSSFAPLVSADSGDDQFTVAANHYKQGRWQLAVAEFQTMIARHPGHSRTEDSLFFLGESLMQLEQYPQASVQFDRLLHDYPNHRYRRQATFRRGEAAHFANDDKLAREYLGKFVDRYGLDPLAAYAGPYLASRQLAAGEFERALDAYNDSLRRFPQGPLTAESQFGRAEALQKLGRKAEAVAAYQTIASDASGRFANQAGFQLGLIEYADGDYRAAERTLLALQQKLNQSEPQDTTLAVALDYWLGLTYKGQAQWEQAADMLISAAKRSDDPTKRLAAGYHAGDALLRAEQKERAEAQFAAIAPTTADTEWEDDIAMARLHLAIERDDRAAVERFTAMFEQKLSGSTLKTDATRLTASYLLKSGDAEAAAEQLHRIAGDNREEGATADRENVLRGPATVQDDFTLAIALQRSGKLDEAINLFQQVATQDEGRMRNDSLLAQATIFVERKQFAQAVTPLENYLALVPPAEQRPDAIEQLVICLARSDQLEKGRAHYETLRASGNDRPEVTLALAEAALQAGERNWAAELFAAAGRSDTNEESSNPQAIVESSAPPIATQATLGQADAALDQKSLAGLAWSQYLDNSHEQSAATFEQLLNKYPDSPLAAEAAYTRGQSLEKLGKLEPALEMYLMVVDKHRDSPQYKSALLRAGSAYDALQHNGEALAMFDRLLDESPESELADDALYQSAWVARELQRDDAAERFLKLHRDHRESKYWPDATYRLAVEALGDTRHDEARRLTDDLIAASPPAEILEHTLYLSGQIAAATGDWKSIEAPLTRLLTQYPTSSLRLASEYWLAEASYQQEQFETAGTRFAELARKIQGVEGSWPAMVPLRQAQLLAREKKWKAAQVIAEQIPVQYPQFSQMYEATYLLGRCHFAAAQFDEARAAFTKTIEQTEGRKLETAAMAQWMIGESYFHQKRYDSAVREYFRVEALYDWPRWQAGALLQAGKCYEHLGQWAEAVNLYDRLVDKYPQTTFTKEATRRRVVASQRAGTSRQ